MFIECELLDKVLKLYLVYKSKNRDFHHIRLQSALTRNLNQRLNTHSVSQGHILTLTGSRQIWRCGYRRKTDLPSRNKTTKLHQPIHQPQ